MRNRYPFSTEAVAWTAIAETLEMCEAMPFWLGGGRAYGLSSIVIMLKVDELISTAAYIHMQQRAEGQHAIRKWRTNANLARQFARDARREARQGR